MDTQPQQRFCTNCGQALSPGATFCVNCGAQVGISPPSTPGQTPAGAPPNSLPPYAQVPPQAQDDPLLAALAAGSLAGQMGRLPLPGARRRPRRWRSGLLGCGCLLLILAALAGPFIGVALTSGRAHLIFAYVAGGMILFFFLVIVIAMLATRRGREALLEAILGGFLDGG